MAFLPFLIIFLSIGSNCPSGFVSGAPSPCEAEYSDWLSKPDDFLREDEPKLLPGLHVLCVWQKDDGKPSSLRVEAFSGGVDRRSQGIAPQRFKLPIKFLNGWKDFRASLKSKLGFTKASNNWGYLSLKQAFGIFNGAGERLASPRDVVTARLALLFEGGQWIWPPVREGFVRKLPNHIELETMSTQPVLFRIRGFLEPRECSQIIDFGKPHMFVSPVSLMDKDKGRASKEFRTSTQARLDHDQYPLLKDIDERVSGLTRVPVEHNEQVQILRYMKGQYYAGHMDNWDPQYYSGQDTAFMEHGHRNRLATVFWYLTNVSAGGQTLFPRAKGLPQPANLYTCDQGLKIKPEVGAVILWYSLHPNGNTDPNGLHSACPVLVGPHKKTYADPQAEEKWSANYWVWNKPRRAMNMPDAGVDADDLEEPPAINQGIQAFFTNAHDMGVKLFWKDPQGREVFMKDIMAGETASMNSFPGHTFAVRSIADAGLAGDLLGTYTTKEGSNQNFIIGAEPKEL